MRLLALRGATTFAEDTKDEIDAKTQALVRDIDAESVDAAKPAGTAGASSAS